MKANVGFDSNIISMKKVLIALDYNPSAEKVAEVGYTLAKTMGAKVVLMHVVADYAYYVPSDLMFESSGFSALGFMQRADMDGLDKASHYYLEKVKEHLGDDDIELVSRIGNKATASMVLNVAEEVDADLIVIGSHSRRWLDDLLLGSVAEEVLSNTKVPMFIIPIKEE